MTENGSIRVWYGVVGFAGHYLLEESSAIGFSTYGLDFAQSTMHYRGPQLEKS